MDVEEDAVQSQSYLLTKKSESEDDEMGDWRLIKRRLQDGKGEFPMDCPLHDSLLRVHYKGMLLNKEKIVFYDTRVGEPLKFSSGEGMVPEGFEMCVRLMLPGEIALVTCSPDYAYYKFSMPSIVPGGAHVQWEIELLGFEMPKDWTGLNFKSIMDEAEKIRVTGNRLFKEGKFELAKAKYEKVLWEFNHVNPQTDEEGKVFLDTRVLDATPIHVKALYRRGMAYMAAGDFVEAGSDFQMYQMIKVDKSSEPDATAALAKLKKQEQEVERGSEKPFGPDSSNAARVFDSNVLRLKDNTWMAMCATWRCNPMVRPDPHTHQHESSEKLDNTSRTGFDHVGQYSKII
ncbi:hypothetical protein CRYUN_Cryun09bG0014600 [Craigia yunnanensis]